MHISHHAHSLGFGRWVVEGVVLTYIGMCRGQRLTSGFCPLLLLYLTLYRVFPEPGVFFQLNWLGSKPPGSDVFSPLKPNPHWGYRHTLSCPDFISVLGNLNSGPHTEPCPHPPVHSFKISYLSLFYVCGCFTCMHACAVVSLEARGGCWIPWNRSWE